MESHNLQIPKTTWYIKEELNANPCSNSIIICVIYMRPHLCCNYYNFSTGVLFDLHQVLVDSDNLQGILHLNNGNSSLSQKFRYNIIQSVRILGINTSSFLLTLLRRGVLMACGRRCLKVRRVPLYNFGGSRLCSFLSFNLKTSHLSTKLKQLKKFKPGNFIILI